MTFSSMSNTGASAARTDSAPRGAKGMMPLVLGGKTYTIFGGPFRSKPGEFNGKPLRGVKMAAEIGLPCDVNVPTEDFNVPEIDALKSGLRQAVNLLLDGETLWVGCMGGIGRTGLFLAALAKLAGQDDPVRYVRSTYLSHAVETQQQQAYIAGLDLSDIKKDLRRVLFLRQWLGWAGKLHPAMVFRLPE